ncbi:hypothetical protein VF_A0010 [Aliivibrio fischeri ES114]|uniref:Uncharacterized protein n=2 Tax=Aliivibrio fischeri TaxID=668 RepID=Q5E1L6_ALIF1|nr:hypothetical protein VF_A0010 [Aliivibrio fischeri ES114]MUJ19906.1 hypothetical protein [Aliivibrio fischeri]MUK39460.1 hypothetical protein [Aliivibrio fischeri]MUK50585.1 hypothetical protein [Aliivibrio fischeri]MUL05828.1 hypothetical protein [Aliivibrio fischeri]
MSRLFYVYHFDLNKIYQNDKVVTVMVFFFVKNETECSL